MTSMVKEDTTGSLVQLYLLEETMTESVPALPAIGDMEISGLSHETVQSPLVVKRYAWVRETPGRETTAPFVLLEIERRSAVSLSQAVKRATDTTDMRMVTIFFGDIIISFSFFLGDYGMDTGLAQL